MMSSTARLVYAQRVVQSSVVVEDDPISLATLHETLEHPAFCSGEYCEH
jgi:hypothetical protein